MVRTVVRLKERSYPVLTGSSVLPQFGAELKSLIDDNRLFVLFDANVYALHYKTILNSIKIPQSRIKEFVIPSGEKAKSLSVLSHIYDFLLQEKVRRQDIILTCGGGVTSDLGGYAAATTLRGLRWVALPTTLLGMVDAAIGGKTGINHTTGKNLIGAIWQPNFVCNELEFLETLPGRQMTAGLGEVLKYAGLQGKAFLAPLQKYCMKQENLSHNELEKLISLSVQYKAKIVSADEREFGMRAILNFGHTYAHAIEASLGYGKLLHGEAVIIGVIGALHLSRLTGSADKPSLESYNDLALEMLARVPHRIIESPKVLSAMTLDKKRTSSGQSFILLKSLGKPIITDKVSKMQVVEALKLALQDYKIVGGTRANAFSR
ncbi:MAG: 3-dehydroquinate synthase [candidate division Zixibacteria bacterium]|nr:3-dehydroquinate synthase [candidate division Zixibacteria bacterium]